MTDLLLLAGATIGVVPPPTAVLVEPRIPASACPGAVIGHARTVGLDASPDYPIAALGAHGPSLSLSGAPARPLVVVGVVPALVAEIYTPVPMGRWLPAPAPTPAHLSCHIVPVLFCHPSHHPSTYIHLGLYIVFLETYICKGVYKGG